MNIDGAVLRSSDAVSRMAVADASRDLTRDKARLLEASREFEALFLKQMLNTMRNTVQKTGLVDGGFAEKIYEDMLYDEYAAKMAKTAKFGIAEMLYDQMSAYL